MLSARLHLQEMYEGSFSPYRVYMQNVLSQKCGTQVRTAAKSSALWICLTDGRVCKTKQDSLGLSLRLRCITLTKAHCLLYLKAWSVRVQAAEACRHFLIRISVSEPSA